MIETFLTQLAWQVETYGLSAVEADVAVVVAAARATGASPVLVAVLADRSAPEPVRTRAFGRLAMHLGRRMAVAGPPPVGRSEVTTVPQPGRGSATLPRKGAAAQAST